MAKKTTTKKTSYKDTATYRQIKEQLAHMDLNDARQQAFKRNDPQLYESMLSDRATAKYKAEIAHQKYLARQVGSWGSVIYFEVSDKKQITFKNFNKSVSGRWKEHQIVGKKPLSEFAGPELVSISMVCVFSVAMGMKPKSIESTLKNLEKAIEKGKADYLYVKGRQIGSDKMRLTSMSEAWDVVMIDGSIAKATVELSFTEYITKAYKHGKNVAGTKVPWEFLVGESAKFIGGKVYKKNNSKKGKKKPSGKVKVTKYQKKKKHPYYVEHKKDENAAKAYTEEVRRLQEELKKANRTDRKTIQLQIKAVQNALKQTKAWKGWVDSGTLKA